MANPAALVLDRLRCGSGDGLLADAIVHPDPHAPTPGNWGFLCDGCLGHHRQHVPGFYFVRFRADRDRHDTTRTLKYGPGAVDYYGP